MTLSELVNRFSRLTWLVACFSALLILVACYQTITTVSPLDQGAKPLYILTVAIIILLGTISTAMLRLSMILNTALANAGKDPQALTVELDWLAHMASVLLPAAAFRIEREPPRKLIVMHGATKR